MHYVYPPTGGFRDMLSMSHVNPNVYTGFPVYFYSCTHCVMFNTEAPDNSHPTPPPPAVFACELDSNITLQ